MKRFMTAAAVVLVLFFATPAFSQQWFSGAPQTNPAINTILVDTGALDNTWLAPTILCASTVAAVVVLEWRDSANATNLKSQYLILAANTTSPPITFPTQYLFTPGERLRVRLNAAITGSIQCSFLSN